jgi:NAD(P)H dehydrogenase (quinone)
MTQIRTTPTQDIKVVVVYHSGYGNTAKQAQAVAAGAHEVEGVTALLVSIDTIDQHWQDLDEADALIFGAPTYMAGPSGQFKTFMDSTSKVWADNLRWKNKLAGAFTNSSQMSGDKLNTLMAISLFAAQHGMQWVGLDLYGGQSSTSTPEALNRLGGWLGAMAQSNSDTSEGPSASDLKTAAHLGQRIATLAKQWVAGREVVIEAL